MSLASDCRRILMTMFCESQDFLVRRKQTCPLQDGVNPTAAMHTTRNGSITGRSFASALTDINSRIIAVALIRLAFHGKFQRLILFFQNILRHIDCTDCMLQTFSCTARKMQVVPYSSTVRWNNNPCSVNHSSTSIIPLSAAGACSYLHTTHQAPFY